MGRKSFFFFTQPRPTTLEGVINFSVVLEWFVSLANIQKGLSGELLGEEAD